jgi:lysophospholipase L1-like esterase
MTTRILPNRTWTDGNGTFTYNTVASVTDAQAAVYFAQGVASRYDQLPSAPLIGLPQNAQLVNSVTDPVTGMIRFNGADVPSQRGSTVAILGDSFTAHNVGATVSRHLDYGYYVWANALMGSPFNLILNAGVSGERTDQIALRVPTVIAAAPSWCIVQGGINDISASVSVATIVANLQQICVQLVNVGINVALLSVAPNTQVAGNSTKVQSINQTLREWCRDTARGVTFIDAYALMVNSTVTTGALATGMSDDSLHPSMKGARAMGQAIANALAYFLPNRNFLPSSNGESYGIDATSKQLLDNPMLTGTSVTPTGTGASGTAPTSWLASTGGSGAASAIFTAQTVRTDGIGYDQQIVISGAASGSSVNIRQNVTSSRAVIGDTLYVVGQIKITGAADIKTINLGVNVTIDGTTYQCNTMEASGATSYDQSDMSLTLRSPDMLLSGVSITAITVIASVTFGTSGTGAATIKFGRLGCYKH